MQEWLGSCDVAVVLGSALTYRTTAGVGLKLPETVIHVLMDGDIIGKNYPATVPIQGDSRSVAAPVAGCVSAPGTCTRETLTRPR